MAATKEQERKALARIKKIVEELGEDSYIGMAFEGCFEVAEENIENDFACSMKQRAEHAEMEAGSTRKCTRTPQQISRQQRQLSQDLSRKFSQQQRAEQSRQSFIITRQRPQDLLTNQLREL